MKKIIFIYFSFLCMYAHAQTNSIQKDINRIKTNKHIQIPGTRLFLIPPPGYEVPNNFIGLRKGADIGLQVFDAIGGNFYSNAATFGREAFEEKGIKVLAYNELKVNGFPAKYVQMQADQISKTMAIVFGDSTFATSIMAIYPANDVNAAQQLKDIFNSIFYDKNLTLDPRANQKFTLDESKSIFKFAKSFTGIYMYSIGGVNKETYKNEPVVTVSTFPKDKSISLKGISDMLLSNLEKYGLSEKKIGYESQLTVNGQPAYEAEVSGRMKGENCLIYILIVGDQEKAIAIQGIAKSDFETNLIEFKNLAKTVKLK